MRHVTNCKSFMKIKYNKQTEIIPRNYNKQLGKGSVVGKTGFVCRQSITKAVVF